MSRTKIYASAWRSVGYVDVTRTGLEHATQHVAKLTPREARRFAVRLLEAAELAEKKGRASRKEITIDETARRVAERMFIDAKEHA